MKYIAFTVKGLEPIANEEIKSKLAGVKILDQGIKRIIFETDDVSNLVQLRTVDDLGYFIGSGEVADEEAIINLVKSIDLSRVKQANGFSLTLSFAGAGKINKEELIEQLIQGIKDQYRWQYLDRDHSRFDLRLFLDHRQLFLSARLTEKPLFHRSYRTVSVKGALRPTIAAAMIQWASEGRQGLMVVDNFCGGGTILAEALINSNQVFGGDISSEAIKVSRQNLANLRYSSEEKILSLNALKTRWRDNQFDAAISNLPWDKQVKIESVTQLYQETLKEYDRIVKNSGVICLLVAKPELLIKLAKKIFYNPEIKTIKLGYLGQNPSLVRIKALQN